MMEEQGKQGTKRHIAHDLDIEGLPKKPCVDPHLVLVEAAQKRDDLMQWPPQMPADFVPEYKAAEAFHHYSTAPSMPPPLPPPLGHPNDALQPHLE